MLTLGCSNSWRENAWINQLGWLPKDLGYPMSKNRNQKPPVDNQNYLFMYFLAMSRNDQVAMDGCKGQVFFQWKKNRNIYYHSLWKLEVFTLIMNKIPTQAPEIMWEMTTNKIWTCYSSCTNCMLYMRQEVGVELKATIKSPLTLHAVHEPL